MTLYEETTHGICVQVEPSFMEDRSDPDAGRFCWSYRVKIENRSDRPVTLRNRKWIITSRSDLHEIEGPGVVGEQPRLKPGEAFEYASSAPLSSPSGLMVGHYVMEGDDGETLEIRIPAFSLDSPYDEAMVN